MRVAALSVLLLATPAAAQVTCGPSDQVVRNLSGQYGETPVLSGVTDRGQLMQLWLAPSGRTWTVTISNGHGLCVVASGRSLERAVLPLRERPS
jgi:hypothetical protein